MAENLPTFVIHEISARLPCEVDRLHMALACRQWRQALAQQGAPPLLRRLPWLVFPFVEGPAFCCVACGGGIHSTTHHVRAPELERRARYFGSHDGRWLLLAGSRLGINMVTNVRNGCGYLLPDKSIDPRGEVKFGLYIHATALSCSPGEPNCIGAAIIQYLADLRAPISGASWTRWVAGCCSWGEAAPDPTRWPSTRGSGPASTSWTIGASTTTRSCSAVSMRGSTPAATPASGRKGRLPISSASSRRRALRTTLLRLGFSFRRQDAIG